MKDIKLTSIKIGEKYSDNFGEAKVLCFVEKNYLVAKRKGCIPFISTIKSFAKRFNK